MSEVQTIKHFFENVPLLRSERLILRGIEPAEVSSIIDLSVVDAGNRASARVLQRAGFHRLDYKEGLKFALKQT